MYQSILDDLKSRFGNKVLLSPEEVAPIIAINPAVQANLRSQGRFPIPIRKIGKKIGISIFHLAEFIANGTVTDVENSTVTSKAKPTAISEPKRNGVRSRDWLRAFEVQVQYQRELLVAIEYEILRIDTLKGDLESTTLREKI